MRSPATLRWLSLALCCAFPGLAAAEDTGLVRVHVSKKAGQAPVVTTRPVRSRASESSRASGVVDGVLDALFNSGERPSGDAPTDADPGAGLLSGGAPDLELEGGRDAAWLYTSLRTSFKSAAAPGLGWSDRLVLKGAGEHAALWLSAPDDSRVSLGLEGGYLKNSWWNHAATAGGTYASERVDMDCAWAAMSLKYYPLGWMSLSGELGAAGYSVHTRVDTNASSFEYDGLAGDRFVALLGLGAGLTTPRRYRLTAGIEGVYYLPGSDDTQPPIETGFARVSAGLKYRF